jgi:hypothetical protein
MVSSHSSWWIVVAHSEYQHKAICILHHRGLAKIVLWVIVVMLFRFLWRSFVGWHVLYVLFRLRQTSRSRCLSCSSVSTHSCATNNDNDNNDNNNNDQSFDHAFSAADNSVAGVIDCWPRRRFSSFVFLSLVRCVRWHQRVAPVSICSRTVIGAWRPAGHLVASTETYVCCCCRHYIWIIADGCSCSPKPVLRSFIASFIVHRHHRHRHRHRLPIVPALSLRLWVVLFRLCQKKNTTNSDYFCLAK